MDSNDVLIRLASNEDFEDIYKIWLDGVDNSFNTNSFNEELIKNKFSSNFFDRKGIFNFWVAVDVDNTILGWQSLMKFSNNPFKEHAFAESSTYISKYNRKSGLGKNLLDYVLKAAELSELEYIIAFVSITNEPALRITGETGWIRIGKMPQSKKAHFKIDKYFLVRPV